MVKSWRTHQLSNTEEAFLSMGSNVNQSGFPCVVGQARTSRCEYLIADLPPARGSGSGRVEIYVGYEGGSFAVGDGVTQEKITDRRWGGL